MLVILVKISEESSLCFGRWQWCARVAVVSWLTRDLCLSKSPKAVKLCPKLIYDHAAADFPHIRVSLGLQSMWTLGAMCILRLSQLCPLLISCPPTHRGCWEVWEALMLLRLCWAAARAPSADNTALAPNTWGTCCSFVFFFVLWYLFVVCDI